MNKILVEILCPLTGRRYDFWLSKKLTVENAIEKLSFEIKNYENNASLFADNRDLVLFHESKFILDRKTTLYLAGVKSGDTLVLV